MRLARATGCFRDLTWNLELDAPVGGWEALREALSGAGWCDRSRLEGLWDLTAPAGDHHLVIVPRSAWLQLRLSYLVPTDARPATALELAEQIAGCVTSSTTSQPGSPCDRR